MLTRKQAISEKADDIIMHSKNVGHKELVAMAEWCDSNNPKLEIAVISLKYISHDCTKQDKICPTRDQMIENAISSLKKIGVK